jgi:hypothetical protein
MRGDQFTCRGLPKVVVNLPMDRPFCCCLAGASSGLCKPHQSPSRPLSCAPLGPSGGQIPETVAHKMAAPATLRGPRIRRIFWFWRVSKDIPWATPNVRVLLLLKRAIGGDPAKLKTYCEVSKLQDQMDQAEQKKDTKAVAALGAKADNLGKQLGPDYERVMAGLESIDPNSSEGKRYTALFQPLFKQCK